MAAVTICSDFGAQENKILIILFSRNCDREKQIGLHIRSVSFTLTFVFYRFCFKLRMLPIA